MGAGGKTGNGRTGRAGARAACALALTLACAPAPALCGAWPQERGEGILIVTTLLDRARRSYDGDGRPTHRVQFDKQEVSAYLEYGLGWGLTAVGRAAVQDVRIVTPTWRDAESGAAATELALRKTVLQRDNDVVSVQGAVILPADVENVTDRPLGEGDRDYEARLLYGRGFSALGGQGFAEAQAAWRWRTGAPPDEARIDLTAGLDRGAWLGLAQVNLLAGSGAQAGYRDYASAKLQVSVARRLGGRMRLELGAYRTVAGRHIVRETAAFAALWREF